MITESDILTALDNSGEGKNRFFIWLGNVYSYLIDCRLNVFRSNDGVRWAIAAERLGFNPRAGEIQLDISYFGNCLFSLGTYSGEGTNYYSVHLIDFDSFNRTVAGEVLKPDEDYWIARGVKIGLSRNKQEYVDAGIQLRDNDLNEISPGEIARLIVTKHREVFRATDEELYKSIPIDLEKVLVLDEWFHKDFFQVLYPETDDEHLRYTYEFNKNLTGDSLVDYENFASLFRRSEQIRGQLNQQEWQDNRPSSYETWQLIAKVIVTGEISLYKPTLQPNTHWKNWPESGSL